MYITKNNFVGIVFRLYPLGMERYEIFTEHFPSDFQLYSHISLPKVYVPLTMRPPQDYE